MPWTWYLAKCEDCEPPLSIPFRAEQARDEWVEAHRWGTEKFKEGGHTVTKGGHD